MDDPYHLETMYSWFQYSVRKAPPHIISPTEDRKWNIEYIEPYGRCTVATRDIAEGEVLFVDHPVITGPKQNSELMCLGCYRQLESWDKYQCAKCGWPMCSPECESRGYHLLECTAYQAANYKPELKDFGDDQFMYESMLPLRCFFLQNFEKDKWETLMAMESHNDLRRGTELWDREQTNVVNFIRNKIKVDVDEETLHTITGILDVNCHEVRSNIPGTKDQYRVRGIYPLCAMMSHFCSCNTHHTLMDDMTMVVIASRPIKKGEQMTASYTHLLSATTERRKHLKYGKFFDCVCDRCADATELGTYFGALKCSQAGCGGNILCSNPTQVDNDAPWRCDECQYEVKAATVERLNKVVACVDGYLLPELTEAQLTRKIACCRDLLKVLDVLDPGISRLRGLTLYELHAPLLIAANRAFQETTLRKAQFLEKLHEAEGYLERTVYCLQFEPNSSVEGQICKIARGSLAELKTWIQTVKELPVSHFLPEEDEEVKPQYSEEDLTLETLLKKLEEQ
ncbi:SET domain-containing protein SmydA-8-like [Penaeus monodon]|uniref:SET domain-containing protein SmydA-8-like n=1 Tax=Penaeus monodon TaxID=6687 RepID=UPI0018A7B16B|nr:SET domain-containing protein SmydA-8-like [Penaeus monodon]